MHKFSLRREKLTCIRVDLKAADTLIRDGFPTQDVLVGEHGDHAATISSDDISETRQSGHVMND